MSEVLERIEVRGAHHGLQTPAPALHKGPIPVNYQSKQVRDGGSVRKKATEGFLNLRLVQSLSQRERADKESECQSLMAAG